MIAANKDSRNALACALVAIIALLLAWPFANLPFNDDWTWSFTVKRLYETGHLVYNGWSSPSVIAQAYWGLLWVKALGFSFNVLRISTFPMAAGSVALSYALARRAILLPTFAIFVAMLLGLSPLFIPLASSFMTDVPGLFFITLSIYAIVRGAEAPATLPAIVWLVFAAVMALVGGSSRQIVWIVPISVLPYVAWIRRGNLVVAISAACCWIAVLGGAVAMQRWFGRQPYSMPDPPLVAYLHTVLHHPKYFTVGMRAVLLTTMCLVLPAALTLRPRTFVHAALASMLLVALCLFLLHRRHAYAPWMGNMLTPTGILGSVELSGDRPVVIPFFICSVLSVVVLAALSILVASLLIWLSKPKLAFVEAKNFLTEPRAGRVTINAIGLTLLGYLALEATRCVFDVAYDRHLLPLIPLIAVLFLFNYQHHGHHRMPICAWILLAVYGLFAIASTQDLMSLARAKVTAIERLKSAGLTDTQIEAGFEHDYWTELQQYGHVNDPRVRNPVGAYDERFGGIRHRLVLYRLEAHETGDTIASRFGSVSYFSLLPPFNRTVCIDRYTDPWWADPVRAATRPVARPHQLIPDILLKQYETDSK